MSTVCPRCGAQIAGAFGACSACGTPRPATAVGEDCPLPVSVQNWNIACFATFWAIYYLVAPVSYIGLTHANILAKLGNTDDINNLPSAVYLWLTPIPVLITWIFPHPRYLKPLAILSVGVMTLITAAVACTLWSGAPAVLSTRVVIAHGALFGAANGFLITALWDVLRRGVSTSRRGKALGYTFGIGPLFACVGSVLQDACLDGSLLGGRTFGLAFPNNYLAMFAATSPLILLNGVIMAAFVVPPPSAQDEPEKERLLEIGRGLLQFLRNRNVLFAVVIYVIVYSGGNAILQNVSLYAQNVLGDATDTVGQQNFLRFGFKAGAGALLGWLLAKANPRATLLATTAVLLAGMVWALVSGGWGWPFMLTFGILGAGELFGAHFPNYVTTASEKKYVRINMAYLGVLTLFTGFSAYAFGQISTTYGAAYGEMQGRLASIYVAAGILVLGLGLIVALLPANPAPRDPSES
jgi:predicted MFS family arabinose efflux permease